MDNALEREMEMKMNVQPFPEMETMETHHCVTGSLLRIYRFHGQPISEEMLLGLGVGVGFVYWHMKGTLPFYGGRANTGRKGEMGLEKTTGKRTGVGVEFSQTGSARKAEKSLLELLSTGTPVMLQVDMGFLPYFNFPEEYHFGGHIIVAAGYDPDSGTAFIADRGLEFYPVSLEDLAKARGSTYKPFPPKHRWYTFDFSGARAPTAEEVWEAISEAAEGMLEPPITNLGVKGIRKAAKRTLMWHETMDLEELQRACFNIFVFIDPIGGSGGGVFRYMYGRFLGEAADITGERRLAEVGEEMRRIGDRWQEVAGIFKEASKHPDPMSLLPGAMDIVLAIADREQAAWERLHQLAQDDGL